MNPETRLQEHGDGGDLFLGSVSPPVFKTSLFTFPDCAAFEKAFRGEGDRFIYSRVSNPTVRFLERKVAELEGAEDSIAFASGMGAISAVLLAHLSAGDHLLMFSRSYAPTLALTRGLLRQMGIRTTLVPPLDVPRIGELMEDRTRLIYAESPASLTFEVLDLERVAAAGRSRGVPTATDNSWATPLFQRPLSLGIDIVLHSGTKYLGGHSDILLGVAAGSRAALEKVRAVATLLGASPSPEDAFLATRGLRTLPIRMRRHEESAFLLARRLLVHPGVVDVLHPALPFFPTHALWKKQFSGSSGLFAIRIRGDVRRFADVLRIFRIGVSWGGFESLVLPNAVVASAHPQDDLRPDIPRDLIRLSIGLEDPEDLWQDLERGLAACG
jgi:cystathionine beta-lyase